METAAAGPQPPTTTSLLDLPDKALLTVLRCLATDCDLSSLFSAARAHSTLHQLSAAALTSIRLGIKQRQQVAGVLSYLERHKDQVDSLLLRWDGQSWYEPEGEPLLDEVPPKLQLTSLSFASLRLQLLEHSGALQAWGPLKQLAMFDCALPETSDPGLAKALSELPSLEHLVYKNRNIPFLGRNLAHLQQLTYLDVINADSDVLDFVHLAPGLRDLRAGYTSATGSKLSALHQLTSLQLCNSIDLSFDSAGLANKRHLQHLKIQSGGFAGKPGGVAAVLSQLQHMTQLTHLALPHCWRLPAGRNPAMIINLDNDDFVDTLNPNGPPAAAYAALTASSSLHYLDVSNGSMPAGVWQHVLPADRQLQQLRVLDASYCGFLGRWGQADTARLASCCPNLQDLKIGTHEPMAADVLRPLCGLGQLTALQAGALDGVGLTATAELTQLRQLTVLVSAAGAGLLQLTQLKQLSYLFARTQEGSHMFYGKGPEDQPVWQQVLNFCMRAQQPGVGEPGAGELAQQAAASLEELAL